MSSAPSTTSQKITTFLWYEKGKAEEAAAFYVSIFKNSRIVAKTRLAVPFILDGQEFCALNGGPEYKFTPAVSLYIKCKDQDEIDHFWAALTGGGGAANKCGWLHDKYGLSWQVVPEILPELLQDPDQEKAERVLNAMLGMVELDIAALKAAHAGNPS